jgi:hypothetical protein
MGRKVSVTEKGSGEEAVEFRMAVTIPIGGRDVSDTTAADETATAAWEMPVKRRIPAIALPSFFILRSPFLTLATYITAIYMPILFYYVYN